MLNRRHLWLMLSCSVVPFACSDGGSSGGGTVSPGNQCDLWDPSACGPNLKCSVAEPLTFAKCVDFGVDQVGDSCVETTSGDSCDRGAACIDGVCEALCQGSALQPSCPARKDCHFYSTGVPICEFECNPLVPGDCLVPSTQCAPSEWGPLAVFTCHVGVEDRRGGTLGDPCEEQRDCAEQHVCAPESELAGSCVGRNCCTPLCDTSDVDRCSGIQSCQPFYPSNATPQGYEDVGACQL